MLRIRREASNGSFSSHCQFPDSTNGNTSFHHSITEDSYATSDRRLKDNQQEISAQEALSILEAVAPKKYTRNNKNNEARHGFIAQEIETAVGAGHFACLVGTTDMIIDEIPSMKSVDYACSTAILWTVCRDLSSRLKALETANGVA